MTSALLRRRQQRLAAARWTGASDCSARIAHRRRAGAADLHGRLDAAPTPKSIHTQSCTRRAIEIALRLKKAIARDRLYSGTLYNVYYQFIAWIELQVFGAAAKLFC